MRTFFIQVTLLPMLIILNNCTTIKSSNIVNNNGNQNVTNAFLDAPKVIDDKWQPAIFEGLKIGESSRADALRILGKPSSSTISDYNDSPVGSDRQDIEEMDQYENFGFYGELTVIYSKKSEIISEIVSYPKNLKVNEAVKHFGGDFKKTQYDFVVCPGDAGSSRIYESKNGVFKYIEYRSKGIAIKIDNSEKQVEDISFVSQPIGSNSPNCSEKNGK